MKSIMFSLLTGSLLLGAAMAGETGPSTGAATKDVPLGHKDFYPSPQRPVGWRNDGTGVFPDTNPPLRWVPKTKWTEAKNIRWQRTFDRKWSNAQPIVVGKHVLAPLDDLGLACLDADTGEVLWRRELRFVRTQTGVAFAKDNDMPFWKERKTASPERIKELDALLIPRTDPYGDGCQEQYLKGYSFATPVSDGTLVYVKNLTGVLAALDLKGDVVWARDIGYMAEHGSVSSPCLFEGRLIVWHKTDDKLKTFVLSAFDAKTGRPLWQTEERPTGVSTPSPVLVRLPGATVVLAANGDVVRVTDGKILAREINSQGFATPTCHENVVFFSHGGKFAAVRLSLKEDGMVAADRLWEVAPTVEVEGKNGTKRKTTSDPYGAMLYHEGYVYAIGSVGFYVVLDAQTGKIACAKILPRVDRMYGNLSLAGGRIYFFAMNGRGFVVKPGPEGELLAENPCLGPNTYSPFFAGNRMYVRNSRVADWMPGAWIRCIEEQKP
jgi:outer membrane protein assembly factor BamB